ncbi:MAG: hypothetical protein GXO29_06410 [Thermotogae bacterium]|nr:hypothetical protein [Thermotogota bacterium]
MSAGVYLILLAIVLRFAGERLPFSLFKERILISRILPLAILLMVLSVHLLRSHLTLGGMYIMLQMFPEFGLLLLAATAYVLWVGYKLVVGFRRARALERELLAQATRSENGLYVLPTDDLVALNVGLLNPKIVVSEGVLRLPDIQRDIVIKHEEFHARRRDNFRILLLNLLLPTRRDYEDFRTYLEIENDRALSMEHSPRDIAHTLVKFSLAYAGAFGMATSLRRRIEFLAGEGRLLNLRFLRLAVLMLLPIIWYIAYTSCSLDLCIK